MAYRAGTSPVMIYLLGGPPRVGKSTIAGKIRLKHALSSVSTDSLGAALGNVWSDETAPAFFVREKFNKMSPAEIEKLKTTEFAELTDYARNESQVIWKAVVAFAGRENEEGRDVLIEGDAVRPELVNQLDGIPYRVVFVGNQGANHKENIKKSAEENKHDWMRNRSDQYYSIFASFVSQVSVHIEQQAKKYGFGYIEIGRKSLARSSEEVMSALGLSAD